MKTVTLYINNENLDIFNQALATKGEFKAEFCKSKIYTTTVFISRKNGEDFNGNDLFLLGALFGGLTEKALAE